MATYYCALNTGGCNGVMGTTIPAQSVAAQVVTSQGKPFCYTQNTVDCVGIAAVPPIMMGNNQITANTYPYTPKTPWGSGLSPASGYCYKLTSSSGLSVYVAITDRCGGYCSCPSKGTGIGECGGQCIGYTWPPVADLTPNCQCRGSANTISTCSTQQNCDWCAANDHPHFDLDTDSFNRICGAAGSAGSCSIASVTPIANCVPKNGAWPI